MGKSLVCSGNMRKLRCKLDENELTTLPPSNIRFDLSTLNNLNEIKNDYKKGTYYIKLVADEKSEISCNEDFGKFGIEIHCRAIGSKTADFPEIWEEITDLDEMREIANDKDRQKAYELFNKILEKSFPEIKDKIDYLKIFEVPKLEKYGAGAFVKAWEDDNNFYPLIIGFSPATTEDIAEDETSQKLFMLDAIHELSHVARMIERRYKKDVGEEEGENYVESLVRGDWIIRTTYPLPHGEVEETVYAKTCILPKQYCFESLGDAREFEEFNYEIVTGEEEPKPITPESPNWGEIERRIPIAPIVDMLRGIKGSYNVLTDVKEYWIKVTSPSGKKYMYMIADLHVDNKDLNLIDVIKLVDSLDAINGNEDIERIWDYP